MSVIFEWHENKAAQNVKKHGVRFEEAMTVFCDTLALIFPDDDHSVDERREIILGCTVKGTLLMICFTETDQDVIRIFSARRITRRERKDYEENTKR